MTHLDSKGIRVIFKQIKSAALATVMRPFAGCLILVLVLAACGGTKLPEADGDIAWLHTNGAIDQVPDGWEQTKDYERAGYNLGGEILPTLVSRDYLADRSGFDAAQDLTDVAVASGWEPSWSVCETFEARVGFTHPERDDVLLTSRLSPSDGAVRIEVSGIFDRPGWARKGTESMECFVDVIERLRLRNELPKLERLSPTDIEARLSAADVANILGRDNVTARAHDSTRVQYLDGDEFLIVVDPVFSSAIPELDGRTRDEVYIIREEEYLTEYRIGLGDTAVKIKDYTKSGPKVIDDLAAALNDG